MAMQKSKAIRRTDFAVRQQREWAPFYDVNSNNKKDTNGFVKKLKHLKRHIIEQLH